jgi:hypothetical protein
MFLKHIIFFALLVHGPPLERVCVAEAFIAALGLPIWEGKKALSNQTNGYSGRPLMGKFSTTGDILPSPLGINRSSIGLLMVSEPI